MKVTVAIVQEINRLYKLEKNMKEIGEILGLCSSTVCKYVWVPRGYGPIKGK